MKTACNARSTSRLLNLSGLTADEVNEFRETWNSLTIERKQEILGRMAEVTDDHPSVDFTAVFRLGLADIDEAVRIEAIDGLWDCQDRWLLVDLMEMAESDASIEARAAAASSLGKFALLAELDELLTADRDRLRDLLERLIENEREPLEVRRRAIEAISPFSDDDINDYIRSAYYDDDLKMQSSAVYAMGVHCDPAWLPALLKELKSEYPELRFEAARACGEMEDRRATEALAEAAQDDDAQVRRAAIESLGRVGGPAARQALRRLTEAMDESISEAAQAALEELEATDNPFAFDR